MGRFTLNVGSIIPWVVVPDWIKRTELGNSSFSLWLQIQCDQLPPILSPHLFLPQWTKHSNFEPKQTPLSLDFFFFGQVLCHGNKKSNWFVSPIKLFVSCHSFHCHKLGCYTRLRFIYIDDMYDLCVCIMCVFLACMYVHHVGAWDLGGQKRTLNLQNCNYGWLWATMPAGDWT